MLGKEVAGVPVDDAAAGLEQRLHLVQQLVVVDDPRG